MDPTYEDDRLEGGASGASAGAAGSPPSGGEEPTGGETSARVEGRIVSILIPAVGGQGGGVLTEWIFDAAILEGYPAQSTSIPGVAQRTGSTSYVIEIFTRPRAELGDRDPVFSLFPTPGALDVLVAPELLEVGRAIEAGFASSARTTIVASTQRLYSIHEKMPAGDGIYPRDQLEAAAARFSRRFVGFDALAAARAHGTEVNAVLLGALAATEVLPIRPDSFRKAIERKGVQVPANLRGFEAGYEMAQRRSPEPAVAVAPRSEAVAAHAAASARFPEPLRPILGEALARLTDYQDLAYADRYLARLVPIIAADHPPYRLSQIVARHLAVWMTYEDAIRVADLKTRAARFRRIVAEHGRGDATIVVTDYLKPDLDEIYGLLPDRLIRPFARFAERRWPHGRPTIGQHVRTTTVTGFLRLWLLARLRPLRPFSYRARCEHERMARWLAAIRQVTPLGYDLGCEVARAAQLVKGYGDVRRRMTAAFDGLLASVLEVVPLDPAAARDLAETYRTLALQGPEGEAAAAAAARTAIDRLRPPAAPAATPG
jgi:indolepyruvate ferredoxin oxidoreductase beta subunit